MKKLAMLLLVGIVFVSASSVKANTIISTDGTWYPFGFGDVGSTSGDGPFDFSGPATLTVTDAYLSGDQFRVYDNGVAIFDTSVPTIGHQVFGDPDAALLDPYYSSGSWNLGAGSHSIDIFVLESPFGGGGAFLRATTVESVPEIDPNSVASALTLLFGGLAVLKRRNAKASA